MEGKTTNKNNKKKIIKSVLIIVMMIMILGTSYALWTYTFKGNLNTIERYSVDLEFLESSDVISLPNAIPISNKEGKSQEETFDFQVRTKTKRAMDITYGIYIEKLDVGEGYTAFNDNDVKIYLTDFNNNEIVAPKLISNLKNYMLYTKTNSHSKTNEEVVNKYKLRIWLDENVTGVFSDQNTKVAYSFKLGIKTVEPPIPANAPVLSENMIPVYYDDTCNNNTGCWEKADSTNSNINYKWYDYDNMMWANSVTVSTNSNGVRTDLTEAPEGTEIPMDRILTMQVWIPRYKYTIWNYNSDGKQASEPQEIDITFESGTATTGEIECTDLDNMGTSDGTETGTKPTTSETCIIKSTSATCTNATCNGKTYTHPAFTFGDKELTGFWVGKFEVSSDTNCSPANSNAIGAGCNLTSIRPLVKPNETSWRGAMVSIFENNMMAMNDSGNKYGFATTDDTHMMKNMEWGAVAYLSHSEYGINKEIALNSYSSDKTGCGPQSEGSTSSGSTCNAYNTTLGQSASTTGNIYGIYDMSGGAYEYVMGNMISYDGETMVSMDSGYSGLDYDDNDEEFLDVTGYYEYPDDKYFDKYSFGNTLQRSTSKLGDAIREVAINDEPVFDGILIYDNFSWYSVDGGVLGYVESNYDYFSWFYRGGYFDYGSNAGVFYSNSNHGNANTDNSSRLVISQ